MVRLEFHTFVEGCIIIDVEPHPICGFLINKNPSFAIIVEYGALTFREKFVFRETQQVNVWVPSDRDGAL